MKDVKIDRYLNGERKGRHGVADERIKNWTRLSHTVKAYGYDIVEGRIKRQDGTIVGKIIFNGLNVQVVQVV